jgi:hypothetical protein
LVNNLNLSTGKIGAVKSFIEDPNILIIVAPALSRERAAAVSNSVLMGANKFVNFLDPTSVMASTVKFGCGNYVNSLVSIGSSTIISCRIRDCAVVESDFISSSTIWKIFGPYRKLIRLIRRI